MVTLRILERMKINIHKNIIYWSERNKEKVF